MEVLPFRSLAPVNEAHTELVRVKEVKREEQLRLMSKRAFQAQQASAAEFRRSMSEGLLKRAGQQATEVKFQNPNTWRYAKPQRQLKHQVLQGDGRPKILSRVFLNGEWTYCA
ncbi:unnamed protein product [Cladocopium goreaui]|uniref:Uncharacterized protein n=1 Tax=Cladocopium goreaui TaxID=2562237 RepID=A0A9P1GLJ0_9DINO|nr:unnamed protein product [Cladocopium goreaui]